MFHATFQKRSAPFLRTGILALMFISIALVEDGSNDSIRAAGAFCQLLLAGRRAV